MLPRWARAAAHPGRAAELARALARFRNGGALARAYLRLAPPAYPFTLRARSGAEVPLAGWHDAATAWVVFCRREYRVPRDARCIVDVGGNWGAFALYAAEQAPDARIVSVEPHPDEYPRLARNLASAGLDGRVAAWQLAVAGAAGPRWMDAHPAHPGPSRGMHAADAVPPSDSVPVHAVTLPELLDRVRAATGCERIDLVKMDVEGAEHEILPHLSPETLAGVDAWAMEYHPNGPRAPLFAALERAGLRLVHDAPAGRDSGVAHFRR